MRNSGMIWVLMAIMLMMDIYIFQVIRSLMQNANPKLRLAVTIIYWLIALAALVVMFAIPYLNDQNISRTARTYLFALLVGLFFSQVVASVFFIVDDVRRGITWGVHKIQDRSPQKNDAEGISRSAFLSWLGLALGGGLLGTLIYGFSNKYKYQVVRKQLQFPNVPDAFRGLRIVHISDIHSGSFTNKAAVAKGVEKILKEKPDLILFTGDLVNDRATEM